MPSLFLSRQQWTLFGVLMSTAAMMTYATGTALNGQLRPYADLSVTMRSPASALPGMTISYAVKIQNAGPTNAVGMLRSTMADYMQFESAKGAKCIIVETELRCPFASLGARKSIIMTLTFTVAEDAPCNTYSVHGVSVGSPNRADQKPYNNQTSTRTKIVCPVPPKVVTPPPSEEPVPEPEVSIPEESSSSSSFESAPLVPAEESSSSSSEMEYGGF